MFFITYLRRELRRRMRQATFIALGLALGIGLVITVIGASNGVKQAQSKVLADLYGVGTDLTVTITPKPPTGNPESGKGGHTIQIGPNGGQQCTNGKCTPLKGGDVIDNLGPASAAPISASEIGAISGLHDVKGAVGGLLLVDNRVVIPTANSGSLPQPSTVNVDGVDLAHENAGPVSNASITKGRNLSKTDKDAALVDSGYASAHSLKVGGTVTLANVKFTIVGIVTQPESTSPPDVYIPLSTAQALASNPLTGKTMAGDVNTIYVTAASGADIARVQTEIQHLVPDATVTSSASLASQITGSLASTAKLANELGKWLAILVLIAAFVVASLLTMAAVSRRVPEFGTLKALGWRGSRIVSQVLGESVATGILGGAAGIGLGFAGVAIIDKIAPRLSATIGSPDTGPQVSGGGIARAVQIGQPAGQGTVSVPMSASVTIAAVALAVVLAVAGGLLAGSFGGWRAARLRPAAALTKVA
ncbi:MAG: ABC transporter permease [Streptosporangiaceae bacterium]|nr:ABC transporter permease [Streptosporangiaceae bacterium]